MSGGVSEQEIARDIVVALVSNEKFNMASSSDAKSLGDAIGEIYRSIARAVAKSYGRQSEDSDSQ